ncbi:MAG: hypothetical protein WCG84_04555, partial [Candidatus Moraniibacteriota bacterium]
GEANAHGENITGNADINNVSASSKQAQVMKTVLQSGLGWQWALELFLLGGAGWLVWWLRYKQEKSRKMP